MRHMSEMESKDPCDESLGDCSKAALLVDKFIDDILDDSERTFVENHLSRCRGCSNGFHFETSFHTRLRALSPTPMPTDVKENILLALGFPGLGSPMNGAFSAVGPTPDIAPIEQLADQMGIPKGEIPKGIIPKSQFFGSKNSLSGNNEPESD